MEGFIEQVKARADAGERVSVILPNEHDRKEFCREMIMWEDYTVTKGEFLHTYDVEK